MRGWAATVLFLVLLAPLLAPATGHHGGLTAGIVHSGPKAWTVPPSITTVHTLQGQIHADTARDITIGLPDGFRACTTCRPEWIGIHLESTTPAADITAIEPISSALVLRNVDWDHSQTLLIDFTVTITLPPDADAGTYPFWLGVKSKATSCTTTCLNVGAVARVEATVPDHPIVHIVSHLDGAAIGGRATIQGDAQATTAFTVDTRIDDGPWLPARGTSAWATDLDTPALPDGPHTLTVRAVDAYGLVGTDRLTFRVDNSVPAVGFLDPRPESVHAAGRRIHHGLDIATIVVGPHAIQVAADDGIGTIDRVTICIFDATNGATLSCRTDTTSPYTDPYWEERPDRGRRILTAQAYDTAGNGSPLAQVVVEKL